MLLLNAAGAFENADTALYDFLFAARNSIDPIRLTPRIVSVDITDKVEAENRVALDSREIFLDAFAAMRKAGLRGSFDFLFAETKDANIDSELADSAEKAEGSVIAIVPLSRAETNLSDIPESPKVETILARHLIHPQVIENGTIPVAEKFLMPYDGLAEKAPMLAHVGLKTDRDGLFRRTPLLYRWKEGFIPALALAAAMAALNADRDSVVLEAGRFLSFKTEKGEAVRIPIDTSGNMLIPYPGYWSAGPKRIPLDIFAAAAADDGRLAEIEDLTDGALINFCDLTTAKKDFGTTPLESVYPLSGIHTAALNAILTNTFIRQLAPAWRLLISAAAVGAALFANTRKRNASFTALYASTLLAISTAAGVLWFGFLVFPWYAGIASTLAVLWLHETGFRIAESYKERLLLKSALVRYFPHSVADRVLAEGQIDLRPKKKELSILFADIAGFTKWSSDKPPETVHAFLNEYLETMASVLFSYGGTVDKYIGDGILSFFGDPIDYDDHAARCIGAAIGMQRRAVSLSAKWKQESQIDLKIRIGVNTGQVIVGDLGSNTRVEYTVIGEAVNLAQRMESNAPLGGILATERTMIESANAFRFEGPAFIEAKGYVERIRAYTVAFEINETSAADAAISRG